MIHLIHDKVIHVFIKWILSSVFIINIPILLKGNVIKVPETYLTIQQAINQSGNGDTIIVSPGTYYENINFNGKSVFLTSTYLSKEDESVIETTIIDGNNSGNVVKFETSEGRNSVLNGFTIQHGSGSIEPVYNNKVGGGIYCHYAYPTLKNLIIRDNEVTYDSWANGGGVYMRGFGNPGLRMENCTVMNNSADFVGGIYTIYSNATFKNVIIKDNESHGFHAWGYNPTFENCQIINNGGDGIIASYCSPNSTNFRIINTLIAKNDEDGISLDGGGSHVEFINTTIANNRRYGINCWAEASVYIINSVLYFNGSAQLYYGDGFGPSSALIAYSNLQGGEPAILTNNNGTVNWGAGNISTNPFFVDTTSNNYYYQWYSECISGGTNSYSVDNDEIVGFSNDEFRNENPEIGLLEKNIKLTSFNDNEFYHQGSVKTITWNSISAKNVVIEFSDNSGGSWSYITEKTSSDGEYKWTLPDLSLSNYNCRLKISDYEDRLTFDISDNNFVLLRPSIDLISPNGEEEMKGGSTHEITWTSQNLESVKIEYSLNSGSSWSTIVSSTPDDGSYSWTVPLVTSANCIIKISDASDPNVLDQSENVFSIYNDQIFNFTKHSLPMTDLAESYFAWGDIDNDNDLDLLVTGYEGHYPDQEYAAHLYKNTGNGNFIEILDHHILGVDGSCDFGDVNNDGYIDLIVAGTYDCYCTTNYQRNYYKAVLYINNQDGTFSEATSLDFGSDSKQFVFLDDMDSDGDLDIVFSDRNTVIYENKGGSFSVVDGLILKGSSAGNIEIGDLDSDGDLDIFVCSQNDETTFFYRNDGDFNFTELADKLPLWDLSETDFADYDSDGDLDILYTGRESQEYHCNIFRNDGDFIFAKIDINAIGGYWGAARWGDMDNDGDFDFFYSGEWSNNDYANYQFDFFTKLFINQGGNSFEEFSNYPFTGFYLGDLKLGDIDQDNDLDIVLGGSYYSDSTINVTEMIVNNTGQANNFPLPPQNLQSSTDNNTVYLDWGNGSDQESSQSSLTYNIYVGTTSKSDNIVPSNSNLDNGYRKVVGFGNCIQEKGFTLHDLPEGKYYWSVQTIDNSFVGSNFQTEQTFEIINFKLISPNGNETLIAGESQLITWASQNVDEVKLEYSLDNGSSWSTIIDSTPSNGRYAWTIPNVSSTECLVRIIDLADVTVMDQSNTNFTISKPTVTVMSPNGDERWEAGSSHPIIWTSQYVDNVEIEYSTDGGNIWSVLVSSTPSDGSYSWTLPNVSSTECRVRVTDVSDVSVTDQNDDVLTIYIPSVTVTSPNGDERWEAGSSHPITWTSQYVDNVEIEYSTDNGNTWSTVVASTLSDGIYSWTLPDTSSAKCFIRITDISNEHIAAKSYAAFTIYQLAVPTITVTNPDGGERWEAVSNHKITWASQNVDNVRIEYSTDLGYTWLPIINQTISDGIYSWELPDISSEECLIRIINVDDETIQDVSSSSFVIYQNPTIELISPNGGEELTMHEEYSIEWTSQYIENVHVDYSINNGASWIPIIENYPSTGIYYWTVGEPATNAAIMRISSADNNNIFDKSDSVFNINKSSINNLNNVLDNSFDVKCYPNPVNDIIYLYVNENINSEIIISVFDVLGKLQYEQALDRFDKNQPYKIDISNLNKGIYLLKLTGTEIVKLHRIMKD